MPFKRNVHIQPFHDQGVKARIESEQELKELSLGLKPFVVKIVERGFRDYCKAHRAPKAQEDLEWERFKKILMKHL